MFLARAVFQRQSHKQNLSSVVVDSKEDMERYFSGNDLRQLFSLNPSPCEVSRPRKRRTFLRTPQEWYRSSGVLTCRCTSNADSRLVQVQALQRRPSSHQGSGDALRRHLDVRTRMSF